MNETTDDTAGDKIVTRRHDAGGKSMVRRALIAMVMVIAVLFCSVACSSSHQTATSASNGTKASASSSVSAQKSAAAGTKASVRNSASAKKSAGAIGSESSSASSSQDTKAGKTLVVCFSATGNTQAIAQEAADALGADYFQIEPAQPYTTEDLNYNDRSTRASAEQDAVTVRPEIANKVTNMADYDTIVLCHPIWWGKAPRIILTFLESYDMSGKTIAELCTSASSDITDAQAELKQDCPDANWLTGKRFAAGTGQEEVASWLNSLGLSKASGAPSASTSKSAASTSGKAATMKVEVNGKTFSATLADTDAARDFASRLPMTLAMDEFGGNEKSCYVDSAFSTNGSSVASPINAGDIMLYEDDCIVLFYGTHDNTEWSYVPLATIDDPTGLAQAVGSGSATVTFSAE